MDKTIKYIENGNNIRIEGAYDESKISSCIKMTNPDDTHTFVDFFIDYSDTAYAENKDPASKTKICRTYLADNKENNENKAKMVDLVSDGLLQRYKHEPHKLSVKINGEVKPVTDYLKDELKRYTAEANALALKKAREIAPNINIIEDDTDLAKLKMNVNKVVRPIILDGGGIYMQNMKNLGKRLNKASTPQEKLSIRNEMVALLNRAKQKKIWNPELVKSFEKELKVMEAQFTAEIEGNKVYDNFMKEKYDGIINGLCKPIDEIYSKLIIKYSAEEMIPQFKNTYNLFIDTYKALRKEMSKYPEFLAAYKRSGERSEAVAESECFLKCIATNITLTSGERKLSLPIIKNNNNTYIDFKDKLKNYSFIEVATMINQLEEAFYLLKNVVEFFKSKNDELNIICENYRNEIASETALKEAEAKIRADEEERNAKLKAVMEEKIKGLAQDDGVGFMLVSKAISKKSVAGYRTEQKDNKVKVRKENGQTEPYKLPDAIVDGNIKYNQVDVFSKIFAGKKNRDFITNVDAIVKTKVYSKVIYEPTTGIRTSVNGAKDIMDCFEKLPDNDFRSRKLQEKLYKIPVDFPVFDERQQGIISATRIDGVKSVKDARYQNSSIYLFEVDNEDLSDGIYRNTGELTAAVIKEADVSSALEDLEGTLEHRYDKDSSKAIYLYDEQKQGALQVPVYIKNKLNYDKGQIDIKGDEVAEEIWERLQVKGKVSPVGIRILAERVKNTIKDIIERRNAAHEKLAEQTAILSKYSAIKTEVIDDEVIGVYEKPYYEIKEIEDTLNIIKKIPVNFDEEAIAKLIKGKIDNDDEEEGSELNRVHRFEFLKLFYADLKQLLSQVKINENKISDIHNIINEYKNSEVEGRAEFKELLKDEAGSEKLCSILESGIIDGLSEMGLNGNELYKALEGYKEDKKKDEPQKYVLGLL